MKIMVNGNDEILSEPLDIENFLKVKGIDLQGVVVELNREIIKNEGVGYVVWRCCVELGLGRGCYIRIIKFEGVIKDISDNIKGPVMYGDVVGAA